MITIQAKKHDNFSVEFKFGFEGNREGARGEFVVNTWIFVPNSLDINPQTYGKDQFYRDIKSNVRLITPVYLLRELSDRGALPLASLRASCERLALSPTAENEDNYESQIKMFAAIFKSALRNHSIHTSQQRAAAEVAYLTDDFVTEVERVIEEYRSMYQLINVPTVSERMRNYYLFGDEIMSHIIDVRGVKILKKIDRMEECAPLAAARARLVALLANEKSYKKAQNYQRVEANDAEGNRTLVFRYGLLKKFIESDLYIRLNK